VPAGDYFLIVEVERGGYLYEADEDNNQMTRAIEVRTPDLAPTLLTAPGWVAAQHVVEVSWTVENGGNGEAKPNWYDRLLLSTDEVADGQDRTLTTASWIEVVLAGGSYTLTQTVTIPNVPAGDYFLILEVERGGALYEADEVNNQMTRAIEVRTPDLTPTLLTAPGWVAAQDAAEVSWTVENQGNGEAKPNWYDRLLLSTDEVADGQDRTLTTGSWTQVVAAGGTYTLTRTVTVPDVLPARYYLIVEIDRGTALYEEEEGNNAMYKPIVVTGPDGFRIVAIGLLPNGRLRIDFTTVPELIHQLESSEPAVEVSWELEEFYITEDGTETQDSIEGTGEILSIYVSPAPPRAGFYRVVIPY
jgi:hypothetical protein